MSTHFAPATEELSSGNKFLLLPRVYFNSRNDLEVQNSIFCNLPSLAVLPLKLLLNIYIDFFAIPVLI